MSLPRTNELDALIVIPTIGKPSVLIPMIRRLMSHLDGLRVHVVVSLNPLPHVDSDEAIRQMADIGPYPEGCWLTVHRHPGPAGFGGAINLGLRHALACTLAPGGIPEHGAMVIANDDLQVTEGWLRDLLAALRTEVVSDPSEVPDENGMRPLRNAAHYGRIGLAGPVSNNASGIQVISDEGAVGLKGADLDRFAAEWRKRHAMPDGSPRVMAATFLSGFCMAFSPDLLDAITFHDDNGDLCLFDERYKIAGYEDNDLCVRADRAGFRAAVSYSTFIGHLGHQTFDAEFPEMQRGMRNRLTYYDIHRPSTKSDDNRLVGAFRVRLDVPNDVNLFRAAIARAGQLCDGIAILLTGPLRRMAQTEEWAELVGRNAIPGDTMQLANARPDREVAELEAWAAKVASAPTGTRNPRIKVRRWRGEFDERAERNALLDMAERMGADWVMSIDHDEWLEARVTREHLDRLFRHPDPMVQSWDFSWLNHWESNRLVNLTPPWGDGGRYTGGMHGFRLYRVNKAAPRRILAGGNNGLHCGNIPQVDPTAKRVAGIRMRHFGYVRIQDRTRKLDRYNEQDPTPNPALIGGTTYDHITHEENQLMGVYAPVNGIGLHLLMYEGEDADNLGRQLDQLYGLVDRIVIVWTGRWNAEDRQRLYGEPVKRYADNRRGTMRPVVDLWAVDDWPATGPSREVARMAEHFGAEWVYQPLNDDLATARNAAIDALHGTPGMGWGYFVDPDEHAPYYAPVMLRRMAETTDVWGWMLTFRNPHADGSYSTSESVRMHRLDSQGRMRMNGRVHETFGAAVKRLSEAGYTGVLRHAPQQLVITNTGLTGTPEQTQEKFDRYRRMLELELRDNPGNAGAWVSLGLYWANEGYRAVALECFNRGMLVSTSEYLPWQEAALEYMRIARGFLAVAHDRMDTRKRAVTKAMIEFLDQAAPPLTIMGTPGQTGLDEAEALAALPAMPE